MCLIFGEAVLSPKPNLRTRHQVDLQLLPPIGHYQS